MQALALDFARSPRRPSITWAILATGALLFAMAAQHYTDGADAADRLENEVARLKREANSLRPSVRSTASTGGERSQERENQLLEQAAGKAWAYPLQAVEGAIDGSIALVSLSQRTASGSLRITAETKRIEDAVAFAERLRATGRFNQVMLTGHETRRNAGMEVLLVTFLLDWGASA